MMSAHLSAAQDTVRDGAFVDRADKLTDEPRVLLSVDRVELAEHRNVGVGLGRHWRFGDRDSIDVPPRQPLSARQDDVVPPPPGIHRSSPNSFVPLVRPEGIELAMTEIRKVDITELHYGLRQNLML